MKRTPISRLLLMGVSPLVLSACDLPQDPPKLHPISNIETPAESSPSGVQALYTSAEDCAASGEHTLDQCKTAFTAAEKEHERTAPHYGTYQECVAEYGPNMCGQAKDGTGSFVPFMAGMLIGQMFDGGRSTNYYPAPSQRYRRDDDDSSRRNSWNSGGSGYRSPSYQPSTPSTTHQALPPPPQTRAVTESRQGFGSQSAARSSWSSSSRSSGG